jgi:CHAD domain-containing protein
VARVVIAGYYRRMREQEREARRGEDPEGVHQMRVLTRRLRGALRLLRRALPVAQENRLRADLRPLARALGNERDQDVTLALLASYRKDAPPAQAHVIEVLSARHRAAKRRAHGRLVHYLDSRPFRDLCRGLEALTRAGGSEGEGKARRFARRVVRRCFDKVRKLAPAATSGEPEPVHALRVAVKNLRYAADALAKLLPARSAPLPRAASRVQDLLGETHDLDELLALLHRAAPAGDAAHWREAVRVLRARVARERDAAWARVPGRLERLLRRRMSPKR